MNRVALNDPLVDPAVGSLRPSPQRRPYTQGGGMRGAMRRPEQALLLPMLPEPSSPSALAAQSRASTLGRMWPGQGSSRTPPAYGCAGVSQAQHASAAVLPKLRYRSSLPYVSHQPTPVCVFTPMRYSTHVYCELTASCHTGEW